MHDLGKLAASNHGFTTNQGKGRLLLRDILPHEIEQFKHILSDPLNNEFDWCSNINATEDQLKRLVSKEYRKAKWEMTLFVILKPGLDSGLEFKRLPHVINGGTVVGTIDFRMDQDEQDHNDQGAYVGVMIHHEFARQNFGKEALIAAFDYVLLGQPTEQRNGNLNGMGLRKVFLETLEINSSLRGLIASLHLKHLEREGSPDKNPQRPQKPTITYIITKADWLEARKHVTMKWMPGGHQTLSRDGSPDLGPLAPGSGQASGSERGRGSGSRRCSGSGRGSGSRR
jgi:RimJ/RimL family protein N-acetyltransferase